MKKQTKIIVIEDDLDINALIAYNLREKGFLVEQVFDGFQAREKLSKEHFNIAIVDIMLSGLNGFDICREIKNGENSSFGTFVIVVSAKTSQQDKLYAHIMGADCYFSKPFSVAILLDAVKEIKDMQDREFIVNQK